MILGPFFGGNVISQICQFFNSGGHRNAEIFWLSACHTGQTAITKGLECPRFDKEDDVSCISIVIAVCLVWHAETQEYLGVRMTAVVEKLANLGNYIASEKWPQDPNELLKINDPGIILLEKECSTR